MHRQSMVKRSVDYGRNNGRLQGRTGLYFKSIGIKHIKKWRQWNMNMVEIARLLLGLRAAGWSEKEINDFVLYIESGEEQYKPKPREKND